MPAEQIILNVTNTQPYRTVVSLLGGLGDYNNVNVNSNTLYRWDLSGVNFSLNANFYLEYRPAGSVQPYSVLEGLCYYSYQGFVNYLNRQTFLGFFWPDGQILYTANDQTQFRFFSFNF
jgi:hypothetical protein